jgi:hypothetical protein
MNRDFMGALRERVSSSTAPWNHAAERRVVAGRQPGQGGLQRDPVREPPDVVREIHAAYFEAGRTRWRPTRSGRRRIVLAEYDIADQVCP